MMRSRPGLALPSAARVGSRSLRPGIVALAFVTTLGCAQQLEQFDVRYASDYPGPPRTVSIFGVFEEGLMSEDGWRLFEPEISAAFQGPACEAAFGEVLRTRNPDLFSRVDEETRTDGVTDDLLAKVAPAAAGESIIYFQMHGRPPGRVARVTSRAPVLLAHGGPESARGNGPGLGIKGSEAHPLELSASIYSSLLRRTIATVGMQYFGSSRADAISKLIHKLVTVIPGAVCAGWRWPASAP